MTDEENIMPSELSAEISDDTSTVPVVDYYSKAPKFESVVDYTTKLSNFEGPMDLLIYLTVRNEIPIKDIFVSDVTAQFIEYVNNAVDLEMDVESEYLSMAATLVELKAKAVLPAVDEDIDIPFGDDDNSPEEFLGRVEEYKLLKDASAKLKEIETTDRFYKEPDEKANDVRVVYKDFTLDGLIKAFTALLSRADLERRVNQEQKEIPKEVFTVADKVSFIRKFMLEKETCSFYELFSKYATRTEIITTFQALLELLKLQYLSVTQEETYGDITITLREDRSEEIGDLSEYN